ncbi:MFS transporter [Priestia megaterium]|uniref:MFS transporter n=1 Tax=Priestia megaterium TaxID=1404 RepID=UPI001FD234A8|nr:MFS transporter [Priestia megaterium]MCF6799566.1 MFS transporter [Bacillus sp. ET1]MED4184323.1 MFS transporter [Priestia megaterium]
MYSSVSKLWTWQFSLIILITISFYLCLQMLTGGFSIFVTEFSHNPTLGGVMTTTFMLAAIITRPVTGILMHKINIKQVLCVMLLFVLVCIMISYNQQVIPLLISIRILEGIGFGVTTNLLATLATNLIPKERMGEGIGYFGMATSLGTTLGPMIALSILHSFSFKFLLFITLFLIVVSFIFSLFIKIKQSSSFAESPIQRESLVNFVFDKQAMLPCFLVMLFYCTYSGIVNFINGLGEENHLGSKVSLFFLIIAVVIVLVRPFSGKVYDQMGHKYLIYPASICSIIGLILIAFAHGLTTFFIAAVLYGIAYSVMQPSFQAWAVSRVTPDKKGTANAMSLSSMDLGMALGAPVLGGVASLTGYREMYSLSSLLIVALILMYKARHLKDIKEQKEI